jgi:CRP/FNR family cyclic AMP-dependent transcriptional regulator
MSEDFVEVLCTSLCPTLSRVQAGALLAATEPLGAPADEVLFREGEPGKGLFFFVAGQVEITQERRDGTLQPVGIVKAPSLLGEISLIMDGAHTATARALSHCELRFLPKERFRRRIEANDMAAYRLVLGIAILIARRLLRLNETLLDLATSGEVTPRVEDIALLKQKIFSEWSF